MLSYPPETTRRHDDSRDIPEIQAATQAPEKQIALTEAEIDQMKETIAGKKQLVRGWHKANLAVSPKRIGQ